MTQQQNEFPLTANELLTMTKQLSELIVLQERLQRAVQIIQTQSETIADLTKRLEKHEPKEKSDGATGEAEASGAAPKKK